MVTTAESLVHEVADRGEALLPKANVSAAERWASALGGGALLAYGATHHSWNRALLMTAGGGLLFRGITGRCGVYKALGMDTAPKDRSGVTSVRHGEGVKVEQAVAIQRLPGELFRFWRNLENLTRFMKQVESVRLLGDGRSHWVVKTLAGKTVEWDAEINNEIENELIAWRTLEGADINHAGSVQFRSLPNGLTEVKVVMSYEPPLGKVGAETAKLFGEEPGQQLQNDLHRFKQLMESGGPSDEIKQRSI